MDIFERFSKEIRQKEDTKENIFILKRVFTTGEGRVALGWIVDKCKFMSKCENEGDMALNNFAKELLYNVFMDVEEEKECFNANRLLEFIRRKLRRSK